jgi:levanase/fructan beta-fructosidase
MPFNQQISFPCQLTLRDTRNGLRIFRKPINEIALLHDGQDSWTNRTLNTNQALPLEPSGRSFHIQGQVNIPAGAKLKFNLRGVPVILTSSTVDSGGTAASVANKISSVEMLLDRVSLEVFVNDGEISLTRYILPNENGISVKAEMGSVTIESLTIHPLKSIWPDALSR